MFYLSHNSGFETRIYGLKTCVVFLSRDTDTGLVEKYKFKWSVPIRDVEIVETEMPALYQVQGGPGRSTIVAPKLGQ